MKKWIVFIACQLLHESIFCWGFYAHQKINYYAVFLLPPEMMVWYKPNIALISEHAVDPDKRRYTTAAEAPRHYIDIDDYGAYPYPNLPRNWDEAVKKFARDSLERHGIVPWWIMIMKQRLISAFREKDGTKILKYSAEIGHYIADAHVPLHVCSNHNGQLTHQEGIHAFWESRIPELLAEKEWDFFVGKAEYIADPAASIWKTVMQSARAADTVLRYEKELSASFRDDLKYAFEERNGVIKKQYASAYTIAYNKKLNNMVERRMRQSIFAIASFWYTCWVDAGQPDLKGLVNIHFSEDQLKEMAQLDLAWKEGKVKGFDCEK
jgi:hypothetical protein